MRPWADVVGECAGILAASALRHGCYTWWMGIRSLACLLGLLLLKSVPLLAAPLSVANLEDEVHSTNSDGASTNPYRIFAVNCGARSLKWALINSHSEKPNASTQWRDCGQKRIVQTLNPGANEFVFWFKGKSESSLRSIRQTLAFDQGRLLGEKPIIDTTPRREIWIGKRDDNQTGTGSQSDPFDGSTQAKFDAILRPLRNTANVTVNILPGTYETHGNWKYVPGLRDSPDDGWHMSTGWRVRGSGMDKTTLVLSALFLSDGVNQGSVISGFSDEPKGSFMEISDLTVDGNWDKFSGTRSIGCASLRGLSHNRISRVRGIRCGSNAGENFPIAIASTSAADSIDNVIEDSVIEKSRGTAQTAFVIAHNNNNGHLVEGQLPHIDGLMQGNRADLSESDAQFANNSFGGWGMRNVVLFNNQSVGADYGINIDSIDNRGVVISDNQLLSNRRYGIVVGGGGVYDSFLIQDNTISIQAGVQGILFNGRVTKAVVRRNEIRNAVGYVGGVAISDANFTNDENQFTDNRIDAVLSTRLNPTSFGSNNTDLAGRPLPLFPTLSYQKSTGTKGSAGLPMKIAPSTFAAGQSFVGDCKIKPRSPHEADFPDGLTVNPETCVIEGVPRVTLPPASFTVVATSNEGRSADALVTLEVKKGQSRVYFEPRPIAGGVAGYPLVLSPTAIVPADEKIKKCVLSPLHASSALFPKTLKVDPLSCVVSGTPVAAMAPREFALSVEFQSGQKSISALPLEIVTTPKAVSEYFVRIFTTAGVKLPEEERKRIALFVTALMKTGDFERIAEVWPLRSGQNIGSGTRILGLKGVDATLVGASSIDGMWNSFGISLNGVDQYISAGPGFDMGSGDFAVGAVYRLRGQGTGVVFDAGALSAGSHGYMVASGSGFFRADPGRTHFLMRGVPGPLADASAPEEPDQWVHSSISRVSTQNKKLVMPGIFEARQNGRIVDRFPLGSVIPLSNYVTGLSVGRSAWTKSSFLKADIALVYVMKGSAISDPALFHKIYSLTLGETP